MEGTLNISNSNYAVNVYTKETKLEVSSTANCSRELTYVVTFPGFY